MSKKKENLPVTYAPSEFIEKRIYLVRGKKVMFDKDLATLYGVPTKVLNQAVKRNLDRFPDDFVFQLTKEEASYWRSQIVTAYQDRSKSRFVTLNIARNIKYRPYAFSEQGVAMLSSALKSKTAILMNIRIIRAFIKLRQIIATNELIRQKLDELEQRTNKHDKQIQALFEAIKNILEKPEAEPRTEIGFHTNIRKGG